VAIARTAAVVGRRLYAPRPAGWTVRSDKETCPYEQCQRGAEDGSSFHIVDDEVQSYRVNPPTRSSGTAPEHRSGSEGVER